MLSRCSFALMRSVAIELVRMSVAVPCATDMFSALPSSTTAAVAVTGSSTSTSTSTSPDVCLSAPCADGGDSHAAPGDADTVRCIGGDALAAAPDTAGDVDADVAVIDVGVIGGIVCIGGDSRMLTALAWAAAACWAAAAGEMRIAGFWAAWWARPRLLMAARLDGPRPSDGVR